jgi:hypothetical protein
MNVGGSGGGRGDEGERPLSEGTGEKKKGRQVLRRNMACHVSLLLPSRFETERGAEAEADLRLSSRSVAMPKVPSYASSNPRCPLPPLRVELTSPSLCLLPAAQAEAEMRFVQAPLPACLDHSKIDFTISQIVS